MSRRISTPDTDAKNNAIGVLYLHHVGVPGGSTRSLINAVKQLSPSSLRPYFICKNGQNIQQLENLNWATIPCSGLSQFDNTENGFYKGARWLILTRELCLLLPTILSLLKARKYWRGNIELIHANEFTLLPTALLAKILFRVPLIVHARALQSRKPTLRKRIFENLLSRHCDCLIAIDSAVLESFDVKCKTMVIPNGEQPPTNLKQQEDILIEPAPLRVGIVANFLRYKGILDFIDAAAICTSEFKDQEIEYHIVGDSLLKRPSWARHLLGLFHFSHDVKAEAISKIRAHKLEPKFRLKGFQQTPDEIYSQMDVLCFPSHLNAVGRPVFEAAFFAIPSIVTLKNLRNHDSIKHGETGLVVSERNPRKLADAIITLARDRCLLRKLGKAAQSLALSNYDIEKNAVSLSVLYQTLSRPVI